MGRIKAMQTIEHFLKNDFKYLYKRQDLDTKTIHLSFIMDSKSHNLQMTFRFVESWCDILCFISPSIPSLSNQEIYWETLQLVSYINWNVKS